MLFSQRQKLARAVERRTRKDEKALNPDPTNHIKTCIVRDSANTIRVLAAMGWLREKPLRTPRKVNAKLRDAAPRLSRPHPTSEGKDFTP